MRRASGTELGLRQTGLTHQLTNDDVLVTGPLQGRPIRGPVSRVELLGVAGPPASLSSASVGDRARVALGYQLGGRGCRPMTITKKKRPIVAVAVHL